MYTFHPTEHLVEIESFISALDVVHPENFYFSGEMHDFWVMVYVEEGRAIATGDERVYNLSTGQIVFHKPLEFHRIWSADGSAPHLNILSVKAYGKVLRGLKDRSFSLSKEEQELFCDAFDTFYKAAQLYEKEGREAIDYRMLAAKGAAKLEVFLLNLIGKESLPQLPVSSDEKSFRRIVEVMNEHCTEALSVDELAALCLMSRSNMKRVFSRFSDIGIAKYFTGLKVRRAMQLLNDGLSANETAARLGFNEVSYFHTVFKRETGLTPMQYQKSFK
jgi:AraC-like DNA-binding protein